MRLPVERTKVVSMGAPLNKYGFEISLFLICLKFRSGLSALQSWKSTGSSSASAEHEGTPKISGLPSFDDADPALGRVLEGSGCECSWSGLLSGSLFRDLDLENSLGGEIGGKKFCDEEIIEAVGIVEDVLVGIDWVPVVVLGLVLEAVVKRLLRVTGYELLFLWLGWT